MSDWLTAEEAAEPLRTTAHQVTKMAKAGQFTKVKWVGNRVRIHKTELFPIVTADGADSMSEADRQSVYRLIDEVKKRLNEIAGLVDTSPVEIPPQTAEVWDRLFNRRAS